MDVNAEVDASGHNATSAPTNKPAPAGRVSRAKAARAVPAINVKTNRPGQPPLSAASR